MHNTDKTSAVVFPGQGSQFAGMADPWTQHPAGRNVLDEASEAMGRDVAAGCRDEASLATTEFVQPALLACAVAAFRVLEAEGVVFGGAAGHSLGEFAALVAADVIGLAEALDIVVIRGRAMQRAGEERPGTMTALLGIDAVQAAALCDEARDDDVLVVANENSPVQVVISGSIPAIERAETLAKERKIRAVRLNVAGAFHSALMEPAVAPIVDRLASIEFGRRGSRSPRTSPARWSTNRINCARSWAATSCRRCDGSRACGAVGRRRDGVRRSRAGRRADQAREARGPRSDGGGGRLPRSRGGAHRNGRGPG